MREIEQDLWTSEADALVITTNGFVKKNGEAVMGRGVAKEAATRFPDLPRLLGDAIKRGGNHVVSLLVPIEGPVIISMPVKVDWREAALPNLILRSCEELVKLADGFPRWETICLPRPGCGNGGLNWDDVKRTIESVLDDRFIVCTQPVEVF